MILQTGMVFSSETCMSVIILVLDVKTRVGLRCARPIFILNLGFFFILLLEGEINQVVRIKT